MGFQKLYKEAQKRLPITVYVKKTKANSLFISHLMYIKQKDTAILVFIFLLYFIGGKLQDNFDKFLFDTQREKINYVKVG